MDTSHPHSQKQIQIQVWLAFSAICLFLSNSHRRDRVCINHFACVNFLHTSSKNAPSEFSLYLWQYGSRGEKASVSGHSPEVTEVSRESRLADGPQARLLWPILKDFLIQRKSPNFSWKISIPQFIYFPTPGAHSSRSPDISQVSLENFAQLQVLDMLLDTRSHALATEHTALSKHATVSQRTCIRKHGMHRGPPRQWFPSSSGRNMFSVVSNETQVLVSGLNSKLRWPHVGSW